MGSTPLYERWQREFHAGHRWGRIQEQDPARVAAEQARLVALWQAVPAETPPSEPLLDQILAIEFCNWRLEESLQALCRGIGANSPAPFIIGHIGSCTEERWRRIWAYYLAARAWLPSSVAHGLQAMLMSCDPDGSTRTRVTALLGERTPLKALYVERLCLTLEYWLRGWYAMEDGGMIGLRAAAAAIEEEIRRRDPQAAALLGALQQDTGALFPCLHKLFRRVDIILSSIGGGAWRAGMPADGGSRAERIAANERFLTPIAAWIDRAPPADAFAAALYRELGAQAPTKTFLAALLVSLLRAQLTGDGWSAGT